MFYTLSLTLSQATYLPLLPTSLFPWHLRDVFYPVVVATFRLLDAVFSRYVLGTAPKSLFNASIPAAVASINHHIMDVVFT